MDVLKNKILILKCNTMKASYLVGGITLLATMTLNFNHIANNYGLDGLNSLHQLIWAQSSSGGGSSSSGGLPAHGFRRMERMMAMVYCLSL